MHEPDVFDGAYVRLAATRLAPGRCPPRDAPPPAPSSQRVPRSRLLPRLALMPPRHGPPSWRPASEAPGRPIDAAVR